MLKNAASGKDIVTLDRLCRMLHVMNFFRQRWCSTDMLLNIHRRFLDHIQTDHGRSFRHILDILELPAAPVVLQLTQPTAQQRWNMTEVADNYRQHSFVSAPRRPAWARCLHFKSLQPAATLKIGLHRVNASDPFAELLTHAAVQQCQVILKRVDSKERLEKLHKQHAIAQPPFFVKGYLFDAPNAPLQANCEPALA